MSNDGLVVSSAAAFIAIVQATREAKSDEVRAMADLAIAA